MQKAKIKTPQPGVLYPHPGVKGHVSPVVVRPVLNSSAAHTQAATPKAGVHKKAGTAPGICLPADVTSGRGLCEMHRQNHGLMTDSCVCLRQTPSHGHAEQEESANPPFCPLQKSHFMGGKEITKKMVEKLDQRRLPAALLPSYCDPPWASKTQNCTWSYILHMVRTQLNAQTGTKGLENSITRLENKGTASKHEEARSSAEMPKQQIV